MLWVGRLGAWARQLYSGWEGVSNFMHAIGRRLISSTLLVDCEDGLGDYIFGLRRLRAWRAGIGG